MSRRLSLLIVTLLAAVPGADAMPMPPPAPPDAPATPRAPVRVEVKTGADNQSMVFVTSGSGDSHAVTLRSEGGKVVVEAETDPDRPWLGVLLDDSKLAEGEERTVKVLSVAEGSPAARGGLERGDVITRLNGQPLTEPGRAGLFAGMHPGDRVKFEVLRDGAPRQVVVELGSRPGRVEFEAAEGMNALAVAGDTLEGLRGLEALESLRGLATIPCPAGAKCPQSGFMFRIGEPPRLGVVVEDMSDQLARFFGVEPGHGVLVKEVMDGSAAGKAGLEAGDVITRVGRTEVRSTGDIYEALSEVAKGDSVDVEVLRHGTRLSFKATLPEVTRRGSFDRMDLGIQRERELERAHAARERAGVHRERAGADRERARAAAEEELARAAARSSDEATQSKPKRGRESTSSGRPHGTSSSSPGSTRAAYAMAPATKSDGVLYFAQ